MSQKRRSKQKSTNEEHEDFEVGHLVKALGITDSEDNPNQGDNHCDDTSSSTSSEKCENPSPDDDNSSSSGSDNCEEPKECDEDCDKKKSEKCDKSSNKCKNRFKYKEWTGRSLRSIPYFLRYAAAHNRCDDGF